MRAQLHIPREFRKLEEKESIHSVGNTTLLQNTCWLASNHIRAYHVKEVNWKSENICGLVPLVPQTPIWQFRKVWYYVSLKKIVWYYTSLRVWYYTSLTKSVWYSTSLRQYDTISMILCALPLKQVWTKIRSLRWILWVRKLLLSTRDQLDWWRLWNLPKAKNTST